MHARELAELAAVVAVHATAFVRAPGRLPQPAIDEYWSASKCRLDRWTRLLKQLADCSSPAARPALAWPRIRPVLEEILVSELLTRLWTAASAAYDAARSDQDLEPICRNIFTGHLDARRRLLALVADRRAIEPQHADALNQLRRRIERWNDMLLAHVAPTTKNCATPIEEFAFDPARAADFADDLDGDAARLQSGLTSQLVVASLRGALAAGLADRTPNADLNRRIGSAVLGCFREDLPDSPRLVKSLWLERITRTARDTEEMIEALVRLEADLPVVGGPS